GAKGLVLRGGFVANCPRKQPRDGIHDQQGRQLAAAQDKVADGNFLGREVLRHALVHSFVPPTNQKDSLELREPSCCFLVEKLSRCGHQQNRCAWILRDRKSVV